jgi:hypothetical protein
MYGLPADVDVRFLCERELVQVAIGVYEVQLHFDSNVSIAIQCHCQVGAQVYEPGKVAGFPLIGLLGRVVVNVMPLEQRHLRLDFDDGSSLVILENDEPYESYTVTGPGGAIVV